jgi:hypothetical protein
MYLSFRTISYKFLINSLILIIAFLLSAGTLHAQETNGILEIDDPLTSSQTLGRQNGGTFTAEGWKTLTAFDYIQYDILTCPFGEVEFDIRGIYAGVEVFPNIAYDKEGKEIPGVVNPHYTFFNMWDRDDANLWYGVTQWHNPYKCFIYLNGYNPEDPANWGSMKLRLNVSAYTSGYEDDPHAFEDPAIGPFDWQRDHVYHHRLAWGDGHMRWYMDGVLIKDWDYSSFGAEYAPPNHSMRIGSGFDSKGTSGYKTPLLVTFSNFKFYRHQDLTPPSVVSAEPDGETGGVSLDSDILVHFSEPMDASSTALAFSIEPSVLGEIQWVGNALFYHTTELLLPDTTYKIRISTAARDIAGNPLSQDFEQNFATVTTAINTIGRYQEFEVPFTVTDLGSRNRYKDVWLKGTFRGPSKTIEIEGFWDGGDVWKVRMAPTETGTWSYTITGSEASFNTSGNFACIESESKGFIRTNPNRPYTFMHDDGTPWLWRGDTSWRGFTSLIPYEGRWKPYIDLRASQGYSVVQSIVVSYIGGSNFWKNEGGLCFDENSESKNYDRLNPEYFSWIDKRIDYALSKGIVPVMVFTWAQEYPNFSREQFEHFERYLVARYAAKNVIWCLSGEYDEVVVDFAIPTSEFAVHGQIVRQYDPYDHPITLHPTGLSSSVEFAGESWFDFVMQQTSNCVWDIQRDRQHNKPVVNGEPRYMYVGEDNTESRRALWEIVTSGGFYTTGFLPTLAPDKGGWDMSALPDEQQWVEILNKLLPRLHWWEMEPHPEWSSNGQLLAKPGEEYLAYSRDGGTTRINLSHTSGTINGEWINPRTGAKEAVNSIQGGSIVTLSPPFSGDWALHLGKGVNQDSIPPNPPTALSSPTQTMSGIVLSWQAPTPAPDGDEAQIYLIYRDGLQIASSVITSFSDQNLAEGTGYHYTVYALDADGNRSVAAAELSISTDRDSKAPEALEMQVLSESQLNVMFSERIEKTSAELAANYAISPPVKVLSAVTNKEQTMVTLLTGAHKAMQTYTLTISNILDMAKTPNRMAESKTFSYKFDGGLRITGVNPNSYRPDSLTINDRYYADRDFTLAQIPNACAGYTWIVTENDDKNQKDAHWLSFKVNVSVSVLVGFDTSISPIPKWLTSWTNTGEHLITSDDSPLVLYQKIFPAGDIVLGANEGSDQGSMYVVLVKAYDGRIKDAVAPAVPGGFNFGLR